MPRLLGTFYEQQSRAMPIIPISSANDPRVRMYCELPKSQYASDANLFITEGDKVTQHIFSGRYPPHSLLLEASHVRRFAALAGPELPIYVAERDVMSATVGFKFHRGVLGCGYRRPLPAPRDVIPPVPQSCLLAICPEMHDPTNLGTLIRTALALGVDALLLGRSCADPLSRRVIRVSMGAALCLPIAHLEPLAQQLEIVGDELQVELCATVLDATAEPLGGFVRSARTALLFGSEGYGLPAEAIAHCRRRITIPMPPATDSLNAAVAAGIFLHYVSKLSPTSPSNQQVGTTTAPHGELQR